MLNDIITGLVETILSEYNIENGTKIKLDNLDIEQIKAHIIHLVWEQITHSDI